MHLVSKPFIQTEINVSQGLVELKHLEELIAPFITNVIVPQVYTPQVDVSLQSQDHFTC